jgi:hypothetical protein
MPRGDSITQRPDWKGPIAVWSAGIWAALAALSLLWAINLYKTWGAWGTMSIDSGHEMYVPAMLAQGKQLYRDLWFMYGPGSPYINACLFRIFGIHLNVLYWAGSLSALGSAIFLFLTGIELSSPLAGWTAGAIVVIEAFQPSHFSFPLPYTFASVYGCLVGCAFLWLAMRALRSTHWLWMFGAGTAAAFALLIKPEFGTACYGTLALLIAVRGYSQRSWTLVGNDVLTTFPGAILCGIVIAWMVSIRGAEFITQENFLSWPSCYFMRTYGKMWLETHGFSLKPSAFYAAMWRAVPIMGIGLASYCFLWWKRTDRVSILVRVMLVLGLILYFSKSILFVSPLPVPFEDRLSPIFFPQDMVFYVGLGALASWGYFWWHRADGSSAAMPLATTYAALLAFRILMSMSSVGYSIYYNGPVVLCFVAFFLKVIPRPEPGRTYYWLGKVAICSACIAAVAIHILRLEERTKTYAPLVTARGTVRVPKELVESYQTAIRFMQEKASMGEEVLSVPEDTSLYFLSGTTCPTRVYVFSPGALAPGKMIDDTIQEIDRRPVRYLLWSNRTYPDFGTPEFGVDFDVPLGDYLRENYRAVGPLVPKTAPGKWRATIWERRSAESAKIAPPLVGDVTSVAR